MAMASRSSKPAMSCNPRLGRFDSYAAPSSLIRMVERHLMLRLSARQSSGVRQRPLISGLTGARTAHELCGTAPSWRYLRAAMSSSTSRATRSWCRGLEYLWGAADTEHRTDVHAPQPTVCRRPCPARVAPRRVCLVNGIPFGLVETRRRHTTGERQRATSSSTGST